MSATEATDALADVVTLPEFQYAALAGLVAAALLGVWIIGGGWLRSRAARPHVGVGKKGKARAALYGIAVDKFRMKPPTDAASQRAHARSLIRTYNWVGSYLADFSVVYPVTMRSDASSAERKNFELAVRANLPRPADMEYEFTWPAGAHYVRGRLVPDRPRDEVRAVEVVAAALEDDHTPVKTTRTEDGRGVAAIEATIPRRFPVTRTDRRLEVQAKVDAQLGSLSPLGAWRHTWSPSSDRYHVKTARPLPRTAPLVGRAGADARLDEIARLARQGRYTFGVTHDGVPVTWNPDEEGQHHGLLAGATGTGKSTTARMLLLSLLLGGADLILLDPKGDGDWVWCEKIPGVVVAYDLVDMYAAIERAHKIAEQRHKRTLRAERVRAEGGVDDVYMNRLVLYSDELAKLFVKSPAGGESAKAANALRDESAYLYGDTAAVGRSAKVNVLGATQRPSREVVDGTTKEQLAWRVALGRMSGLAARIILSNALPAKGDDFDLDNHSEQGGRPGHGWCGTVNGSLTELQTLWVSKDDCYALRDRILDARRPSNERPEPDPERRMGDSDVTVVDVKRDDQPREPIAALPTGERLRRFRSGWSRT